MAKSTEERPGAMTSAVVNHPAFLAVLEKARLTKRAKELAKWAQVVIALVPSKKETGCRLGGDALLPADAVWPVHRLSRKEIPLRFLGCLDFAELAPLAHGRLPKRGSLQLF